MGSTAARTRVNVHLLLLLRFFHCALASITPFPEEALPTKSGYIPINHPKTSSAIFYTFYEAQTPTSSLSQTPLLFWLQGGPGCSSMIGNFFELGPFRVDDTHNNTIHLEPNTGSWNRIFGLVFLDNPIGTGFSIASTPGEIPRNQKTVAKHLFAAITGFLELDPVFKNRPLYLTGESYAGKYVPAIGYYILKQNANAEVSKQVNLKGVAIGNGLTDPVTQVKTHAKNAYYSGWVNERQMGEMEEAQLEALEIVKMGNWSQATNARRKVLALFQNFTGLATLYDVTRKEPYNTRLVTEFLQSVEVKKAIGAVESIVFEECSKVVREALDEDLMKSVKYMVEKLVKETKVLLYQGHFDVNCGVVANEAWVRTMKWDGIGKYLGAERKMWKVNGEVAGYVQKWEGLTNVVVLGAGHLVPTDQGLNSQAMIEDWVLEKGVFAGEDEEQGSASSL